MGRELQKKKNRSSIPKIKNKVKTKSAKKRINPLGNAIIAANWNKEETLVQNYRRLGLAARLNAATGGIEKQHPSKTATPNRLSINKTVPTTLTPTEARIERDPETGKVLRIVHAAEIEANPLNDPLNELEKEFSGFDDDTEESTGIVRELEEQAQMVAEKKPRKQSQREQEWIGRLVAAYGTDYQKMSRDRRLNPMQQTAADISRRAEKWRANGGAVQIAS